MAMNISPLFDELAVALQCFPGVGPKSAQRMALYALERNRDSAKHLARVLSDALERIGHCKRCHVHCEMELCRICSDERRDDTTLCVVETVSDLMAIEQAHSYSGRYFVLLGHLSPLDGIGPEDIGLDELMERLNDEALQEVILATGTTVEGEATAHYIINMVKGLNRQGRELRVSRIAYGVPMGGELELVDSHTLGHALSGRQRLGLEVD